MKIAIVCVKNGNSIAYTESSLFVFSSAPSNCDASNVVGTVSSIVGGSGLRTSSLYLNLRVIPNRTPSKLNRN